MSIPQVQVAGKPVGQVGYGLLQLTFMPQSPPEQEALELLKVAADSGATVWSTGGYYGKPGDGLSNLRMVGKFFKKYPEYKDRIVLVVKAGLGGDFMPRVNDIAWCRNELQEIKTLLGDKPIDVYVFARLLPKSTAAQKSEAFDTLATLHSEGHFKAVGATELSAASLEILSKVLPIAVIEIEVSLWSYEQDIQDVISWSKQHKVPILCYSPLGNGFITRKFTKPEDIPEGSFQRLIPRFQGERFYDNLKLVDALDKLSKEKGVTTSQMALAWVMSLSPYNIPIPGSLNRGRIHENAESARIKMTKEEIETIDAILSRLPPSGGRVADMLADQMGPDPRPVTPEPVDKSLSRARASQVRLAGRETAFSPSPELLAIDPATRVNRAGPARNIQEVVEMREEAEKERDVKREEAEASRHTDVMGSREREVAATEMRQTWERPKAEAETAKAEGEGRKAAADGFAINIEVLARQDPLL
ncbi:MAG: hypothetical protein TREMPRED_005456 [Tremellales sp. Tagirdzhanova-0007]|nr:MAG: hypothetical protein TREMPRED_005456 [Tremellales sp. Tagirdzhanova-0007]